MSLYEQFKNIFGDSTERSPEEARIAELEREREEIREDNRHRPENWGPDPRLEQINREVENLRISMRDKTQAS